MKLQLLHRDDVIDSATLDRMMNDLEPGLARRLRWLVLMLALPLGVMAVVFGVLWAVSDQNFRDGLVKVLTTNVWIYIPILVSSVIVPLAQAKHHPRRLRGLLLTYVRCPHCGYDLRGLPRDGRDGLTVCPECACA